jgi:peptidoglycan/xylan/chitin deacetylase (PgdA/CDA1 family)
MASVAPRVRDTGVRVLLYHAIDRPDPADRMGLRVSPEAFREQMRALRTEGYQVVPLKRLLEAPASHEARSVAITFDDGYRSETATADVLRELGFRATFFLVPRFLDGITQPAHYWERWPHMTWEEAGALVDGGFEVGAHSMTHPVLPECDLPRLADETAGVKALLEQRLHAEILSFSYPYGRYDARVREAARGAGYRLACTSRYGVTVTTGPDYDVARTEITGMDRVEDFRRKLRGQYDWLARRPSV